LVDNTGSNPVFSLYRAKRGTTLGGVKMNSRGQEGMFVVGCAILALIVVLVLVLLIAIVPAGHVGIQNTFGSVSSDVIYPGLLVKGPFTAIISMNIQTQEVKESASVPTSEGLIVGLETSLLYRINPANAANLYKTVGMNYQEVIINPNLRSAIREVTSKYEAKALYAGDKRDVLATEIEAKVRMNLEERGIIVEKVLLRDLILPDQIKQAIELKLQREQESQAMEFVLTKEQKEAERKVIEAQGIKDSQDIINKTLSTQYLQYLWISQLNENPNIIYVPIDSQGLSLFRDVDKLGVSE